MTVGEIISRNGRSWARWVVGRYVPISLAINLHVMPAGIVRPADMSNFECIVS